MEGRRLALEALAGGFVWEWNGAAETLSLEPAGATAPREPVPHTPEVLRQLRARMDQARGIVMLV